MNLSCGTNPIMVLVFYNQLQEEMDMQNSVGGPFLQAAVFCEKVLDEKDGAISAIRIIDRLTFTATGANAPEKMPPMPLSITLLVRFKSGDATGKHELKVKPVSPSGKELPVFTFPFVLGGGELSANMILGYSAKFGEPGVYWFEVMIGDKLYTKVSLNIIYERKQEATDSDSSVAH